MRILIALSSNLLTDYQTQFSQLKREASQMISLINKNNSYWHMYRARIYSIQDTMNRIQTAVYQMYKRGGPTSQDFHVFHDNVHSFVQALRKILDKVKAKEHTIKPLDNVPHGKTENNPAPAPIWMLSKLASGKAGTFSHNGESFVWNFLEGSKSIVEVVKKTPNAVNYFAIA